MWMRKGGVCLLFPICDGTSKQLVNYGIRINSFSASTSMEAPRYVSTIFPFLGGRIRMPHIRNLYAFKIGNFSKATPLPSVHVCTHLMACSRWALRTSGFWFLLAKMSVSVAPVMARWNLVVRRVRFLATSSCCPFLCLRRYSTVQLILRGLRFIPKDFSHLALIKTKDCKASKIDGDFTAISSQSMLKVEYTAMSNLVLSHKIAHAL